MFEELFRRKKADPARLEDYGFRREGDRYRYAAAVMQGAFTLEVELDAQGRVDTRLREGESGEEYILYKTNASGAFVGQVRAAVEAVLADMARQCWRPAVFQGEQTLRVVELVRRLYGDELEFLWEKFPDNGVWRRKDTGKWYGLVAAVPKSKLGLDSQERVEIVDLHAPPEQMARLLEMEHRYPGWHMNKKSWYTVILDGSVSDEELAAALRTSYDLARR